MFTRESLLTTAAQQEEIYRQLLAQHPAGTVHDGRNDAHRLMNEALICAAWMEAHGMTEVANIGPFQSSTVRQGDRVRVKSGAKITTMHPKAKGSETKRAQVITISHVFPGYIDQLNHNKVVDGRVSWAGSGGYWKDVSINDIERLD